MVMLCWWCCIVFNVCAVLISLEPTLHLLFLLGFTQILSKHVKIKCLVCYRWLPSTVCLCPISRAWGALAVCIVSPVFSICSRNVRCLFFILTPTHYFFEWKGLITLTVCVKFLTLLLIIHNTERFRRHTMFLCEK